jgi:hypothetical protein
MAIQSLYALPGPTPVTNVHNFTFHNLLGGPDKIAESWRFLIDADSGRTLTGRDFYERVRDGATVLQSELALEKGRHMVGIVSENCAVRATSGHVY